MPNEAVSPKDADDFADAFGQAFLSLGLDPNKNPEDREASIHAHLPENVTDKPVDDIVQLIMDAPYNGLTDNKSGVSFGEDGDAISNGATSSGGVDFGDGQPNKASDIGEFEIDDDEAASAFAEGFLSLGTPPPAKPYVDPAETSVEADPDIFLNDDVLI